MSGDVTIGASGAATVGRIQGTTVSGVTGTGNLVFSASPTLTGTVTGAASNWSANVGIGTTAPHRSLEIANTIEADILFNYTAGLANSRIWRIFASGTSGSAANLTFDLLNDATSAVTVSAMTILGANGNVGIGTTAPSQKLSVAGTIESTSGGVKFPDGTTQTSASSGIPSGLIAAFATTSCPTGWTEYTPARGRFLRGIDNGAGNDPNGTRAAGNQQADALQEMSGSFKVRGVSGGIDTASGVFTTTAVNGSFPGPVASDSGGGFGTFDASLVARTSTETRPKNVAVTFCQKS